MSLTQDINDELENFGNKINLSEEVFDNDSNITIYSKKDQQNKSLKNRKKGKLYLQPNFTAFTKTNFGTIPSKVEKTLIKTDDNIPITISINKNIQKNNTSNDEQIYKDPRSYSTSYSSKGYGNGFISEVPRFVSEKRAVYPGPAEYSRDKFLSVENDVNKSIFGKSIFSGKATKSLQLLNSKDNQYFTSQEILNRLKSNFINERYSNNLSYDSPPNNNNENHNKGSYFFDSKVKKFSGGMFSINNKNPGPGRYFINNEYKIKNKDQKSADFMDPIEKKECPVKTFGLDINDEKKIGFGLIENKKNGKVAHFWNGAPTFGNSYDFGKTLKNGRKIKKDDDYESNNVVTIPNYDINRNLKRILRFKSKDYFNEKGKRKGRLFDDRYQYKFDKSKSDLIMRDLLKYKKKDDFALAPPRWDQGLFHDNGSHFQIPGPAYYDPRIQSNKISFNLNNKDFIFANSVNYKEIKKYDPYSDI